MFICTSSSLFFNSETPLPIFSLCIRTKKFLFTQVQLKDKDKTLILFGILCHGKLSWTSTHLHHQCFNLKVELMRNCLLKKPNCAIGSKCIQVLQFLKPSTLQFLQMISNLALRDEYFYLLLIKDKDLDVERSPN